MNMDTTYSFTRQQLRNVIRESIKLYLECKEQEPGAGTGYATHYAMRSILESLDLEQELVHSGELEPKDASQIV